MIDTDKYEGHTDGPWTWRGETIDGDGEVNHTVCYMEHPHVNGGMNEANAQLIADAPLILEAYKRLREENTYLNHMLDGVDKHTLDHVAEQAQIKMHEAGECYDFCIVCETEGDEQ